jgi:hypothetical protein
MAPPLNSRTVKPAKSAVLKRRFRASVTTCAVLSVTFFIAQYAAKQRAAASKPLLAQAAEPPKSSEAFSDKTQLQSAANFNTTGAGDKSNTARMSIGSDPLVFKKVKTLVVRPDGDIVEVAASTPAIQQPVIAVATTPSSAVAPPSRTQVAVSASAPPSPAPAQAVPTPPEAMRVSSSDITGSLPKAARTPQPAANGGFFAQLAASANEDEARRTAQQLKSQLSDHLGARDLVVIQASVKDKTVYRVRVADMSRDDANALCNRLRNAKAACFVTRD